MLPGGLKNFLVVGAAEADLGDVDRVPSFEPESCRGVRSQALIQQNPVYAP